MQQIDIRHGTAEDSKLITDLIRCMVTEMALSTVGFAAANLGSLDTIFAAKKRLHISAVYTEPNVRRQGIARQLIQKALDWGRHMNAEEADLNMLVASPSRRLYEHLGFQEHEISMVMNLDQ
jgi:GNAT superfamily N-acetyltransferase